jgi:hypothetical protein
MSCVGVGLCFWDGYWGAGVFHVGDVLGFVDFLSCCGVDFAYWCVFVSWLSFFVSV